MVINQKTGTPVWPCAPSVAAVLAVALLGLCLPEVRGGETLALDVAGVSLEVDSALLDAQRATDIKVGGHCHFVGDEKQSVPFRWAFSLSDEKMLRVVLDRHEGDEARSRPLPGGDEGWRTVCFRAILPGECVVTARHEDIGDEESFTEERVFTVRVAAAETGVPETFEAYLDEDAVEAVTSVRLVDGGTVRLKVGQMGHFMEYEKQSIPYQWVWAVSDESLLDVALDQYEDDGYLSRPMPGGFFGWRTVCFEATSPGECVISVRYEDIREEGLYAEEREYKVVITE